MDGFKDVLSFLGALFGLISALIPLFGYLADRRRRAVVLRESPRQVAAAGSTLPSDATTPADAWEKMSSQPRPIDRAAFLRAEQLVRNPAIFMIVVGALSLVANLATAGIGFVDEFVTPLGIRPIRDDPGRVADGQRGDDHGLGPGATDSERRTTVVGIVGILFFSLASAVAVWSGYNMLRLRNYWLALAGSLALVPGSCMCCLLGIPSGIWSFVVLLNPDVRGAFR